MFAVKGNRSYRITEAQRQSFLDRGYDIAGDDGEIVMYNPGKQVAYAKYVEVMNENEKLRAKGK